VESEPEGVPRSARRKGFRRAPFADATLLSVDVGLPLPLVEAVLLLDRAELVDTGREVPWGQTEAEIPHSPDPVQKPRIVAVEPCGLLGGLERVELSERHVTNPRELI
jgi:hypothetical protein